MVKPKQRAILCFFKMESSTLVLTKFIDQASHKKGRLTFDTAFLDRISVVLHS